MVKVDLSAEAVAEADRLANARALAAGTELLPPDGVLIAIARRNGIRRQLGRRVLLLWRLAYEDAGGRLVESTLVGTAIELSRRRFDVLRTEWSTAVPPAVIDTQGHAWRGATLCTVRQFASTRAARERAVLASHSTVLPTFQPGLFDRRATRAHLSFARASAASSEEMAARLKGVEAAGVVSLRPPQLLLVLIPNEAVGT